MGADRLHQRACAGHDDDALDKALVDDVFRQPLEQGHAAAQRLFKVEFSAHGAFRDLGDLRFDTGIVGELIDAFDRDHSRIHVGDDQAARAVGRLLDDRIGTIKGTLNGGPDGGSITGKVDIQRLAVFYPPG